MWRFTSRGGVGLHCTDLALVLVVLLVLPALLVLLVVLRVLFDRLVLVVLFRVHLVLALGPF